MQTKMNLNGGGWGGLRRNAGRKKIRSQGVAHNTREKVSVRNPLHVNFKYRISVRNKLTLKLLKRSIQNARSHGLRVLHFSFQSNHVHLVLESTDNKTLTKGMRSLTITFAKGLKKGKVQVERYHLHVLKTLKEVKHAVHYVLFNQQRHETGTYTKVDGYSSLLSIDKALMLIKKFAQEKKMVVRIEKGEDWKPDLPLSYLFKRGVDQLSC